MDFHNLAINKNGSNTHPEISEITIKNEPYLTLEISVIRIQY